jgi:hypothetical protein
LYREPHVGFDAAALGKSQTSAPLRGASHIQIASIVIDLFRWKIIVLIRAHFTALECVFGARNRLSANKSARIR